MKAVESLYRLFTIILSYQCCLAVPPSTSEFTLPSVDVMGLDDIFTNVKVKKHGTTANSCQFDVVFSESDSQVIYEQFAPADAEITFLYKKRMRVIVFKRINSSIVYGLNFNTEESLQLFYWSLRFYQLEPESYVPVAGILRYSRNTPNDVQVMSDECTFHAQKFRKPGLTHRSFHFSRLTDNSDGTREGILTFSQQTFSVSNPLGRTKSKFALCHNDIPDEVFIVIFANTPAAKEFSNEVVINQDPDKWDSCEFPHLGEEKKKKIAVMKKRGRKKIDLSDIE